MEGKEREKLLECRIAGTSYHQVDDITDQLHKGDEVFLVRDYNNEYDNHAVAVTLDNPYLNMLQEFGMTNILGYIPKQENKAVATILDMGWHHILAAEITEIHPESDFEKLRIKVCVRQKRRTIGRRGRTSQTFPESSKHERLGSKRIGGRPLPQGIRPLPLGRLSFRHAQPSRKRPTCCILQPSN